MATDTPTTASARPRDPARMLPYYAERLLQQYDRAAEILSLLERDMRAKIAAADAGEEKIESGDATCWQRVLLFVTDSLEADFQSLRETLAGRC